MLVSVISWFTVLMSCKRKDNGIFKVSNLKEIVLKKFTGLDEFIISFFFRFNE